MIHRANWLLNRWLRHPRLQQDIDTLRSGDSESPAKWLERVNDRIQHLLKHASENCEYYRAEIRARGVRIDADDSICELKKLPVLTKQTIRENVQSLCSININAQERIANATGGSTGEPLAFFQGKHYKDIAAALDCFVREWWGITPYDRTALIWGEDNAEQKRNLRGRFYEWRFARKTLNAFRLTESDIHAFLATMRRWRPRYLMGYATALSLVASHNRSGNNDFGIRAIRSTAEVLTQEARQTIERGFGAPVYNFYGSREVNNVAAECPEYRRLHLISPWRFVEIVDDNGEDVPNGVVGNIVITDLSNFAMPFIRYQNGDCAAIGDSLCTCGRPSPIIEKLAGRRSDVIVAPRGELIHGEWFTHLFYGKPDIARFQIHQKTRHEILIRFVPAGPAASDSVSTVVREIARKVGHEVDIQTESCDVITSGPSGKFRFTLSDVSANF